jgi:predicted Zn-dependent peptidase
MQYLKINDFTHLISNPLDRKKVNFEFIYSLGGAFLENIEDQGKKHLLEHCIVSRTKKYNFQEFKDFCFKHNLNFNAYTGAQTMGITALGYYKDAKLITDQILEMAFKPTFDQTILDMEKEIVLREISERKGDPSYKLHYKTAKQVFSKNSIANYEVLGDPKKVAKTTLEDFKNLHQQNLANSHFVLMVSGGGFDVDYIRTQLDQYTKGLENFRKPINFNFPNEFKKSNQFFVTSPLAHEQAEISIYIPVPVNFENRPARAVFEYLFLKYGGVLYDKLRDDLGLIYSMYSNFDPELNALGIYLTSEITQVNRIFVEIQKVFGNFTKFFKPQKFQELKELIHKKQEMAEDELNTTNQFIYSTLTSYGKVQTYQEFIQKIDMINETDLENLYLEIQKHWTQKKIVIVSKNKGITSLDQLN